MSSNYSMDIFWNALDPFLGMVFVFKKGFLFQSWCCSILTLTFLLEGAWKPCSDIAWHCSVSCTHYPCIPSETSLVQSFAVELNEGLVWRAYVQISIGLSSRP